MTDTLPPSVGFQKAPKYLVCVDNREECRAALQLCCMKALARKGQVDMLHVVPPADFQTLGGVAERMREERAQEGMQLLDKLATEAQEQFGLRPASVLREGSVGDEIITAALADAEIITLVIGIAAHGGRGSLAAWLSSQLGQKLPIPLLMVPGNLTHQQLQSLV